MTDEEMAINWIRSQGWNEENLPSDELLQMEQAFLAGLKAGRPKWQDGAEKAEKQLAKAKEIIREYVILANLEKEDTVAVWQLYYKAEQFLSEVEK